MNKENDWDHVTAARDLLKCCPRRNGNSNKNDETRKGNWTL